MDYYEVLEKASVVLFRCFDNRIGRETLNIMIATLAYVVAIIMLCKKDSWDVPMYLLVAFASVSVVLAVVIGGFSERDKRKKSECKLSVYMFIQHINRLNLSPSESQIKSFFTGRSLPIEDKVVLKELFLLFLLMHKDPTIILPV